MLYIYIKNGKILAGVDMLYMKLHLVKVAMKQKQRHLFSAL